MALAIPNKNFLQHVSKGMRWISYALLAVAFVFYHKELLITLINTWTRNSTFSHGFLVPLISIYLAYTQRGKLTEITQNSSYAAGITILAIGFIFMIAGHAGSILAFQELALLINIAGAVVLIWGTQTLKIFWFAIAYLVFMLTFWGTITERLHFPFQLLSAVLGSKMLSLVGIPAFRESIFIELPNITLEVAKQCSGVNTLISICAIGVPLAYVSLSSWSRRVLLIIFAMTIAILANSLRVMLIGALFYWGITKELHGPSHILQGMSVAIVGFIVLFIGAFILSKNEEANSGSPLGISLRPHLQPHSYSQIVPTILVSLIFVMCGLYNHLYDEQDADQRVTFNGLPESVGKWKLVSSSQLPSGILVPPRADYNVSMEYKSSSGKNLILSVIYFENQGQGKELVHYRSYELHNDTKIVSLPVGKGESVKVNSKHVADIKDGDRHIFFWYYLAGHITTNEYMAKVLTIWSSVYKGNTKGALIFVSVDSAELLPEAEKFIQELIPILPHYLAL